MGNNDGILEAMAARGQNKKIQIDGGFFSFAFGSEIALVIRNNYYILNCDQTLWDEVNLFCEKEKNLDKIKAFWLEKQKDYEVSDWSGDFDDLKGGN